MYIQDLISEFIQDTGLARLETLRNGERGVRFLDEGEFIPWHDLGFNSTYGFYRLSALPGVENEAEYATWTIHPLEGSDQDGETLMWALLDADGYGFLLGERWQVAELLPVLTAFLNRGEHGEMVDDEAIGARYLTIAEACEMAQEYDPTSCPYSTPEEQDRLRRRLQRNIQRGNIQGVKRDPQGRYRLRASSFRGWLANNNEDSSPQS